MTSSPDAQSATVWLAPWEPSSHLRAVRHQVNNLLAPVVVAAELLDDGSETARLLGRSVARLRDVSNRAGELLRMGAPALRVVSADDLATVCGFDPAPDAAPRTLFADPERLLANVLTELSGLRDERAEDPGAEVFCDVLDDSFRIGFVLPVWIAVVDPADIVVPFTLSGVDVRLAVACREIALQQGRVGYQPGTRTLVFHLPLR